MVLDGKKEVNNSRHPVTTIQEEKNPVKKLNLMNLTPEDFKDCRVTPDGMFSVYDVVSKFKKCSLPDARQFVARLEVVTNCNYFQFNGRGQRETPVAPFNQLLQILSQLPGEQAKMLRKEQAEITTRVIAGDISVSQLSDILEFKLTLKNNTELSIPVSKDGYVNCTKLCQAGGKRIDKWTANKQSKELLEAYSKLHGIRGTEKAVPRIRGTAFCRVIDGGNVSLNNQGTYYPMDIAIQIAQWVDPVFAIQVSRWTRELLLFGSVTLGQEKSTQELENKFQEQIQTLQGQERNFGLDTLPYERKDVVYTLEFKPNKSVNVDCENSNTKANDNDEDEDRKYYKFGVASDISTRLKQHESDKDFEKVRLDRCFTYNCGYDMSKGEKKIKRILDSMNIRIQYGKKKECFVATTEELKSVYEEMDRYNKVSIYSTIENIKGKEGDDKIEIEKIRINKEYHDKYLDMFERDKITFEQLEKLILTLKG